MAAHWSGKTVSVLGAALLASCMTTRFSHETVVKTKAGETVVHTFEKSYDTSGWGTSCIITGILYGGTCWAYLGMPYEYQVEVVRQDARTAVVMKYGEGGFNVVREAETTRKGYDDKVAVSDFNVGVSSTKVAGSNPVQPATPVVPADALATDAAAPQVGEVGRPPVAPTVPAQPAVPVQASQPVQEAPAPVVVAAPKAPEAKPLKDLANPLVIESYEVLVTPENLEMGRFRDRVSLVLSIRNTGSKRVTAFQLQVHLATKLGRTLSTTKLVSESSSIAPGATETAEFTWEDNRFIKNEMFDKLASVTTENLKVKLLSQKVVKSSDQKLTH